LNGVGLLGRSRIETRNLGYDRDNDLAPLFFLPSRPVDGRERLSSSSGSIEFGITVAARRIVIVNRHCQRSRHCAALSTAITKIQAGNTAMPRSLGAGALHWCGAK